MKIGGYQIVDFKNINLSTEQTVTIDGIYSILLNSKKVILISGLQVDNQEYNDSFAFVTKNENSIELKNSNYIITITSQGVITTSEVSNFNYETLYDLLETEIIDNNLAMYIEKDEVNGKVNIYPNLAIIQKKLTVKTKDTITFVITTTKTGSSQKHALVINCLMNEVVATDNLTTTQLLALINDNKICILDMYYIDQYSASAIRTIPVGAINYLDDTQTLELYLPTICSMLYANSMITITVDDTETIEVYGHLSGIKMLEN